MTDVTDAPGGAPVAEGVLWQGKVPGVGLVRYAADQRLAPWPAFWQELWTEHTDSGAPEWVPCSIQGGHAATAHLATRNRELVAALILATTAARRYMRHHPPDENTGDIRRDVDEVLTAAERLTEGRS